MYCVQWDSVENKVQEMQKKRKSLQNIFGGRHFCVVLEEFVLKHIFLIILINLVLLIK